MTALPTSDPGETVSQNPTVQIAVDHGPQIRTVKPIGPLKTLLIDLFKGFKMILDTMVIVPPVSTSVKKNIKKEKNGLDLKFLSSIQNQWPR